MKMIACLGAALIAGAALMPAAASAAPQQMTERTRTVTTDGRGNTSTTVVRKRYVRGGGHWQTKCRTWWKHGRKMRQCRKVRGRW